MEDKKNEQRQLEELSINSHWSSFLKFRERKLHGLQTGIGALDKILLGLSGITVIQGAPGSNKSTLALQIGSHNAKLGNPSLIIDRENGLERFRLRLLCQANTVSSTQVLTAKKEQLAGWVEAVQDYPIYAVTQPVKSYEVLDNFVRQMWELHKRPMILVVDSIQKMPLLTDDKRTSISLWMEILDQMKLDYEGKLNIIMASEKARGSGGANYDTASLSAAKESGALEYTGEQVLDLRQNRQNGNVICEIVKDRDGISGVAVELQKVLADPTNPQSFTYKLEGI